MENILGLTAVPTKATSGKDCGTAMGCGKQALMPLNIIKDILSWIRKVATEYIAGRAVGSIMEILRVIIGMDMVSSTTVRIN